MHDGIRWPTRHPLQVPMANSIHPGSQYRKQSCPKKRQCQVWPQCKMCCQGFHRISGQSWLQFHSPAQLVASLACDKEGATAGLIRAQKASASSKDLDEHSSKRSRIQDYPGSHLLTVSIDERTLHKRRIPFPWTHQRTKGEGPLVLRRRAGRW